MIHLHAQAAVNWGSSVASGLIYVITALMVTAIGAAVRWTVKVERRLTTQDKALALLVAEVSPLNGTPLRELVNLQAREIASLQGALGVRTAPEVDHDPS